MGWEIHLLIPKAGDGEGVIKVLGVPHQLQGLGFDNYVGDPSYSRLVRDLISDGADFVFEEASGRAPSTAEELAKSILGAGHYLDVDPPRGERPRYGLAPESQTFFPIDPCGSSDVCYELLLSEQRKREELWLGRIRETDFNDALVICGVGHGLSFAFRLVSAGFSEVQSFSYTPFDKL